MCRHPCLVLDLSLESIQSFTLSMMLAVDFSVGALDQTEEVPLYSWFSDSCYRIDNLVNVFSASIKTNIEFFFFSL